MVTVTSTVSNADRERSFHDIELKDDDWVVCIVETEQRVTLRVELRSSGTIIVLRAVRSLNLFGKWEEEFTGPVSNGDCVSAYMAAEKLLRRFRVVDRARPGIQRDEHGIYRVTVATKHGSFQLVFPAGEQSRDKELNEDLEALILVMQDTIPEGRGIAKPTYDNGR